MARNLIRLGFNTDRPGNNSNPAQGRQEAAGSPYREVPYNILAKMTRKPVCLQTAEGLQRLMDRFTLQSPVMLAGERGRPEMMVT